MLKLLFDISVLYDLLILIAIIAVIILCVWKKESRPFVYTVAVILFVGATIFCGIQLNFYYTASGGIFGAITGIFDTNVAEVEELSFSLKNIELTQDHDEVYSARILTNEIIKLAEGENFMAYVNDEPCSSVKNASDYVVFEYSYVFMGEDFNSLCEDTLTMRFSFYTNSTYLSVSTSGGANAVKYWNYYFNKNVFVVTLDKADYSSDDMISIGNGDVSNYCVVNYYVDEEFSCKRVYKKNSNFVNIKSSEVNLHEIVAWQDIEGNVITEETKVVTDMNVYAIFGYTKTAGLYDSETGVMKKSWGDLLEEGYLGIATTSFSLNTTLGKTLTGVLVVPEKYEYAGVNCLVTNVMNDALYNCEGITGVILPETVTSIGDSAFYNCSSLTELFIPDSVKTIETYAFWYCSSLKKIILPSQLECIKEGTFAFCSSLDEVVFSENLNTIENHAFIDCAMKTFYVPSHIKTIKGNPFSSSVIYCEVSFKPVNWDEGWSSNSIVRWGYTYEQYLEELKIFNVDIPVVSDPGLYSSSGELILTWDELVKQNYFSINDHKILNSNTLGGGYNNYLNLKGNLILPNGFENIGNYAFYNCASFTGIEIPIGVSEISVSSFSGCSSITNIDIPKTVIEIGDSAFYNCTKLKNVFIPSSVLVIEKGAFRNLNYNCIIYCEDASQKDNWDEEWFSNVVVKWGYTHEQYLEEVKLSEIVPPLSEDAGLYSKNGLLLKSFDDLLEEGVFSVSIDGVLTSSALKTELSGILILPRNVNVIGSSAFSYCSNLCGIIIPNTVTTIGTFAFYNCFSLEYLKIPDSVTSIGYYAFGSSGLTEIVIPESVVEIGSNAFYSCENLSLVYIPSSVKTIGNIAFYNLHRMSVIYCEFDSKQEGWDEKWNSSATVKWGYTYENYLAEISA